MKFSSLVRVALATALAFAVSADMAHAAPLVGLVGGLLGGLTGTTIGAWLINTAISFGVQSLIAKLFDKDVKEKGIREKMETGGDRPLSFIMGNYPTAGKLVYVNQCDDNIGDSGDNSFLVQVISLSEIPVTALSNFVWINGEKCVIGTEEVSSGFFPVIDYVRGGRPYCMVKFYDGNQTTGDDWLTDRFGSDPDKPWSSDMIGRGCAYVVVIARFSQKGIWAGIPQFKWLLQGIPLYDPRKDSSVGGSGSQRWNAKSTWAYSTNPKVMQYNIIRGISYSGDWLFGGQNVSAYRLPLEYWTAAMDVCDINIALAAGGTVKQFTAGCEITVDMQPIDIIKELDKCCAGYTTEYGGQWRTWCGTPGLSVLSFTDSDIIITEEQTDDLFKPLQETFNGARATYIEPDEGWVSKDAAPRSNSAFVEEDGDYQLIADIDLPFVSEHNQVQRLMLAAINDSRRQRTHVLQMPPEAFQLEPFDVVNWNSERNEYVNKKFMVTSIDDLPNCNQLVALREINSTDYDWSTEYELPKTVGPLTQVKPGALAFDFTASADQVDSESGKDKPAILVEWDFAIEDIDLSGIKYQIRRTGTTKVISAGTIETPDGEDSRTLAPSILRFGKSYQIRLYAIPFRRGRESSWTSWKTVVCTVLDVPTAPTLTRISDLADDGTLDFYVGIDWIAVTADVKYVVKVTSDGKTARYYTDTNYYKLPATSGKTYVVSVAAIGNDGTVGDYSTTASITITKKNTAPTAPTALTVVGQNKRAQLTWNKSPDADFLRAIVYRSATNNFLAASEVRRSSSTGTIDDGLANDTTYYYWVTFEDRSGNESAKFPSSNTGGRSATTIYITGSDTDPRAPNAPTDLEVTTIATDLDNDGRVDACLHVEWIAGDVDSSHPEAKGYEVQVYRSNTLGGSYSKRDTFYTSDTSRTFTANATKFYKVRIRAQSFNGTWTSFSSLTTTGVQPNTKSNDVATVTGVNATARPKGNRIKWTLPSARDHSHVKIYRHTANASGSATFIAAVKGDKYLDADDTLVNGDEYFYWIKAVDTSGNESASFSTVDSCIFRGVNYGDTDDTLPSDIDATPELAQRAKDVDKDGTVDIAVKATWTKTGTVETTNVIVGYVVYLYEAGTLIDTRETASTTSTWKAKVGVSYYVRVKTKGFNGRLSASYKQSNTITPEQKDLAPDRPAGLAITPGHRQNKLKWTACANDDYHHTRVYRDTTSTYDSPSEVGRVSGTRYDDTRLSNDTSYYYWLVHYDRSGNPSARWPTGDGLVGKTLYVLVDDTDPRAPNVPSVPDLDPVSADLDDDGTVDANLSISWTAGAEDSTHPETKQYQVQVYRANSVGTSGSTSGYSKWRTFVTTETDIAFAANARKYYKARVRAASFNGTLSSFSAFTSVGVKPTGITAPASTGAGLAAVGGIQQVKLTWTECPDIDYAFTKVFRSTSAGSTGSSVGKVSGSAFVDTKLANDTTYYYRIVHYDRSGNSSAEYWPNAGDNGVSATTLYVGDDDTDQNAPNIPDVPAIDPVSADLDGDGTLDAGLTISWAAGSVDGTHPAAKNYQIQVYRANTLGGSYSKWRSFGTSDTEITIPANATKYHKARVRAVSFNGTKSSFSSLTSTGVKPTGKSTDPENGSGLTVTPGIQQNKLVWDECGDSDYAFTKIFRSTSAGSIGSAVGKVSGTAFTDTKLANDTSYYYRIVHYDRSGGNSAAYHPPSGSNGVLGKTLLVITNDLSKDTVTIYNVMPLNATACIKKSTGKNWSSAKADVFYLPSDTGMKASNPNPASITILGNLHASIKAGSGILPKLGRLNMTLTLQLQRKRPRSGDDKWEDFKGQKYSVNQTVTEGKKAKDFRLDCIVADIDQPADKSWAGDWYYRLKVINEHTKTGSFVDWANVVVDITGALKFSWMKR